MLEHKQHLVPRVASPMHSWMHAAPPTLQPLGFWRASEVVGQDGRCPRRDFFFFFFFFFLQHIQVLSASPASSGAEPV